MPWQGDIDGAIEQFKDEHNQQVENFIAYLNKHRHRIVNYAYFQAGGISWDAPDRPVPCHPDPHRVKRRPEKLLSREK